MSMLLASVLAVLSAPFQQPARATERPDWIGLFLAGSRALEQGEPAPARELFEDVLEVLPRHAATAWQLAGVHARLGNPDEAFAWLERAASWGGGEAALLAWDPDLESLRGDERYAALLASLHARDRERPTAPPVASLHWSDGSSYSISSTRAEIVAVGATLRDLRAGEILSVLQRPGESVHRTEMSPDGRWVVTTGSREDSDRTSFLCVFDARTGNFVRELEPAGSLVQIEFSRDGTRMLSAGYSPKFESGLWDTADWTSLGVPSSPADQSLLSPDGQRLVLLSRCGSDACDLAIWDVDAKQYVGEYEALATIPNTKLDLSADGALALLLENRGSTLHVFDLHDGRELTRIEPEDGRFTSACFLGATGELATVDKKGRIRVWQARTGEELRSFSVGSGGWHRLRSSPDGRTLLDFTSRGPLRALDAADGAELWSAGEHTEEFTFAVGFTPDGSRVLAGSASGGPMVRDARSGELLASPKGPGLRCSALADPVRHEIWLSAEDGGIRRIDAATGRALDLWKPEAIEGKGTGSLAVSRDRELLAITRRASVTVARTADGSLAATQMADARPHYREQRVPFAPDGSLLLVPEARERIGIFETDSWEQRFTVEAPDRPATAWSSDTSKLAAVVRDGSVSIFDAHTGAATRSDLRFEGRVQTLAFEPGDERLWIGTDRSMVHVVDVDSGVLVRALDLSDLDASELFLAEIHFSAGVAVTTTTGYGIVAGWDMGTGRRLWDYSYFVGNAVPLHCAIGAGGERAYVWGQGPWSARLIDVRTGATLLDLADRGIGDFLPLPDERFVGATSGNGTDLFDAETGARLWSRIELPDDGWLLHSPGLFVDGTREAFEGVHIVLASGSYPLEALAAVLLDPKRVRASAAGVALAPAILPVVPELEWPERPERVVLVAADEELPTVTLEARCSEGLAGFEVRVAGTVSFSPVEEDAAANSTLTMELARPTPGESIDYRWRAVGASGVLSRALHLTIETAESR